MLIADFFTDSPLLEAAFERAPDVEVRAEEQYYHEEGVRYIFWAEGGDLQVFEEGMEEDPTVTDVRRLAADESWCMYRVTATDAGEQVTTFPMWREQDIVLLSATGDAEGWDMRMRFPDRETLDLYRSQLRDRGLSFRLHSLYRETGPDGDPPTDLSESQRAALLTAYEMGYYDVPRDASQAEVADRLGVSPQTVSEGLRRGTAKLVEATLVTG